MPSPSRIRFNKTSLENLSPPTRGKRATYYDTDVLGLQLRITDRGVKSFCVFRRSKRGSPERITIGRFPSLSVEQARTKAKRYLADLGEGRLVGGGTGLKNKPQYPSREVLRDYLLLLLLTGLRRNEALCLRWENVNLNRGTLCAGDTKNRSDHVLPMGSYLWNLMRECRRASNSDWVFANPLTGERITDPHRQIVNVVAKSGVPFSPHDLRRTFASIVSRLSDRLSYYTTKRLLNHRTSDVTQGYIQFDLEQLRFAMQAVEDFVQDHVGNFIQHAEPGHEASARRTHRHQAIEEQDPRFPASTPT